jgi:flavin-binding protein dodecin
LEAQKIVLQEAILANYIYANYWNAVNTCFFVKFISLIFKKFVIMGIVRSRKLKEEGIMSNSVYSIIEIVGTSTTSWEDAAKSAIETAAKTLEDLRVAEIVKQDVTMENGKIATFRVRLNVSFKYHPDI